MRWLAAACVLLALAGLAASLLYHSMPQGGPREVRGYTPWSPEILAVAETLPLQEGGRVKSFNAQAGFTLLALHGTRTMRIADEAGATHRLTPTAWLLDTLFRPELARQQPVFRVDNSAVLAAIGATPGHKRDRYSFADLEPALEKLSELGRTYEALPEKQREPLQQQVLELYYNAITYDSLLHYLDFARDGAVPGVLTTTAALEQAPRIRADLTAARAAGTLKDAAAAKLYDLVFEQARTSARGPRMFPPAAAADKEWRGAGDLIITTLNGEAPPADTAMTDLRAVEETCAALQSGQAAFLTKLTALRDSLAARAQARGDGRRVVLEAAYHRMDWFLRAFVIFALASVAAVAMWLAGRSRAGRVLSWSTLALTLVGLGICLIAITQRVLIMGRPPIGNLYDTIIAIATASCGFALVVEVFFRKRLALGLAPVLGMVLVYLSRRFETGDAKDHLDPLVAVLSSNFWLTLHVITITLGYASGLLAAMLSAIYILMRGLRLDRADPDLRRGLTLATYGMICVTLFLSLVGTVLGGIWANDSWGRFWGWDPKENGALLIVIWTLVILHARLGGFLREWGFHLAGAFLAAVIAFSWWHVNFLNVGLHNYGFTAGKNIILVFYAGVALLIAFGAVAWLLEPKEPEKSP